MNEKTKHIKHVPIFGAMLHFTITAKNKSEAWKILQQISELILANIKNVVVEPFDVSEKTSQE